MFDGFFRGLAYGIASSIGSENQKSNKTKIVKKTHPVLDYQSPSICAKCRSISAHYNSDNQLVCRKCGFSNH